MPATVQSDPPGIRCMFSNGSTAQFSLDGLPCPGLAADLLAGLAEMIHPHGSIDSAASVNHYVLAFARWHAGSQPPGSPDVPPTCANRM